MTKTKTPRLFSLSVTHFFFRALIAALTVSSNTISQASEDAGSTAESDNAQTKSYARSQEETLVIGTKNQPKYEATELTEKLMETAGSFGDPLQAVFSLPGIVQVDEEDAEPAVQGSSPNANLFLVDGMPVKFIFHPFGNSIFNENLIHDFGLNAAGFGARYGQATGAVFNVSLRDPKNQALATTLDLSFLRAGILLEGGVTNNQSFYFSYREGLLPFYIDEGEHDEEDDLTITDSPRASDYQGKYYWTLGHEHSLTLQVTGADDKGAANFGERSDEALLDPGLEGDVNISAKFNNQSLKWQHTNIKVLLGHSKESEFFRIGNGEFLDIDQDSWFMNAEYNWQIGSHAVSLGATFEDTTYDYRFDLRLDRCSDFSTNECDFDLGERQQDAREQDILTYDIFIEDKWSPQSRIDVTMGLHLSTDDYLNERSIDPRARVDWRFKDNWELHGAVGKYHQLPDVSEIFPVVGNPDLSYTEATHYVTGLRYELAKNWSVSSNLYYKDIDKLTVGIEEGDIPYLNAGEGKAYGLELMLSKEKIDRWYGWATLALSKTERTNTLTGLKTPFSYDVPLVINAVLNYQLNEKWNIGGRWTYRTGTLYTPITGNRENPDYPGFYIPVYGELNSKRVSDFHRLDIRVERSIMKKRGTFFIDFINAYNRKNSSGIEYIPTPESSEFRLKDIEGYGLIPSIGVKMTF